MVLCEIPFDGFALLLCCYCYGIGMKLGPKEKYNVSFDIRLMYTGCQFLPLMMLCFYLYFLETRSLLINTAGFHFNLLHTELFIIDSHFKVIKIE